VVISGLILQTVSAVGVPVYAWLKQRHQGIGGHIAAATVRLAWHADVHTRTGLAVIAAGTIIYAVSSILMARPYLSRPVMHFVPDPIAAAVGILAWGVLALVVAILLAGLEDSDILLDFSRGAGSRRRRKRT
jgi:hypothetical protein